jgi:hypothetical protein
MRRLGQIEFVEAFVLSTKFQTDHTREMIRGLESSLLQTRDRIEQSHRRIAASDALIKHLSRDLGRVTYAEGIDGVHEIG